MRATVGAVAPARGIPVVAIALLVGLLAAACGATTAPSASAPAAAAASVDASGSPAAATPDASGSSPAASDATGAGPKPTSWPGGVVEAVIILGKADAQIEAAGGDLGAAASAQDLQKMWGAADGLATLLDKLGQQVDRIRDYPLTAPVAAAYDAALPDMLAGSKKIRDSITAGDAAGLTAGVEQLAKGTTAYQEARRLIGPLVEPALLMQRVLVK